MSKIERITISMPAEMVAKISAAVDAGEYATTSEVAREAMRDWAEQQERREVALASLRAEIDKGLVGPFRDGETVMEELRQFVAKLVREQGQDEAA